MLPYNTFGNTNQPLLHFAHANGFPPLAYRQFLEQLCRHYHVVALQQRPLWDTQPPDPAIDVWQQTARDMLDFFEQQQMHDIIAVGHSLGAVATLYAVLQRPDLFSKLILIEPVFLSPAILDMMAERMADPSFNPMVKAALKRRNQWDSRRDAWERFRSKKHFARMSDDLLWDYVNGITQPTEDGFKLAYPREWEAHFYARPPRDVWGLLPQISHPTLAIRADQSDTLFTQAWDLWQARQPTATFIELPDLGHLLMLENPSLVAETVLEWLA